MNDWYNTPLGQYILQAQTDAISPFLERWFGFHLLQLGGPHASKLLQASPIHHQIYMFPEMSTHFSRSYLVGDFSDLPLLPNSIDVMVMPHVLEFTDAPAYLLQQAYLALIGGGHLVVFGFNPYSFWGLKQWFNPDKAWQGACYRSRHQIQHKLLNAGFTIIDSQQFFYRPIINSKLWLNRWHFMEQVGKTCWPYLGSFYMFVVKKEVALLKKALKTKKTVTKIVNHPVLVEPRQRVS